jgi:Ni,Fe-hydrogenase III small subunit
MIPIILKILRTGLVAGETRQARDDWRVRASGIQDEVLRLLGRALVIRHVDAGSCNGCELELHALNNPYYNIEGLGIRFAASPRHADMLLVTGPVSRHMEQALRIAYEAMPGPRLVVAVGDCGRDGGIWGDSYATCGGVGSVLPVDVVVPGCPPPPAAILQGILTAISARAVTGSARESPGRE